MSLCFAPEVSYAQAHHLMPFAHLLSFVSFNGPSAVFHSLDERVFGMLGAPSWERCRCRLLTEVGRPPSN